MHGQPNIKILYAMFAKSIKYEHTVWTYNCPLQSTTFGKISIKFLTEGQHSNLLDVHGCVHHNINLIEMTNKMQLCKTIYYFIVT